MRNWIIAILVLTLLVVPFGNAVATVFHVVRPGDTVNSLAMEYYGNSEHAILIRAVNHLPLDMEVELAVGEPIIIPESSKRVVRTNETWQDLANLEYGERERAWFLALANEADPMIAPSKGQIISVPYLMAWALNDGLSSTIQQLYPNQTSRERLVTSRLLLKLNPELRPRGMVKGSRIVVPITNLSILPAKRAEIDRMMGARRTIADQRRQTEATTLMERLSELLAAGAYVELVQLAGHIAGATELSEAQQVTLHRYLGQAFVALDRLDLAEGEFARILELQPDFQFDQVTTSPTILGLLERVRNERHNGHTKTAGTKEATKRP